MKKRIIFAGFIAMIVSIIGVIKAIPKIREWRIMRECEKNRSTLQQGL